MKITGKFKTYEVRWRQSGWSWAVAQIRLTRNLFGRRLPRIFDRWLSFGEAQSLMKAEQMEKTDMENWFKRCVAQYERYLESWEGES